MNNMDDLKPQPLIDLQKLTDLVKKYETSHRKTRKEEIEIRKKLFLENNKILELIINNKY